MLPYFNLNMQMLAAHQQALAAAQISPQHYRGRDIDDSETYNDVEEELPLPHDRLSVKFETTNPESPISSSPNADNHFDLHEQHSHSNPQLHRIHSSVSSKSNIDDDNHHVPQPVNVAASTPTKSIAGGDNASIHDHKHHAKNAPDSNSTNATTANNAIHHCRHCGIFFEKAVMHAIHMGYHSHGNDFLKCNKCGKKYIDAETFYLHIGQQQHP